MGKFSENRLKLTRRGFLATGSAAAVVPVKVGVQSGGKRVLTLVYDKALGAMRAVDRVVR